MFTSFDSTHQGVTMSTRRFLLATACLMPLAAAPVAAQSSIRPGLRLRLHVVDGSRLSGTLVRWAGDSLELAGDGLSRRTWIATRTVKRVDISHGRGTGAGKGALIGGAVGIISGVVFALTAPPGDLSRGQLLAYGGAGFGVLGGALGFFFGSFTTIEKWDRGTLTSAGLRLSQGAHGQLRNQTGASVVYPDMPPFFRSTLAAAMLPLVAAQDLAVESRTLAPVLPAPQGVTRLLHQRIVAEGKLLLVNRAVQPDGSVFFNQREFLLDGTPVAFAQEGFWAGRWNRFETRFAPTGAVQHINDTENRTDAPASTFRDPTVLWFWRVQPTVGDTVTVTYLAQNVIATSSIRFTYEGTEELTLAERRVVAHRVREDPLGSPGVYTVWWYDDRGMGIKRYHKTTEREFADQLVAWR